MSVKRLVQTMRWPPLSDRITNESKWRIELPSLSTLFQSIRYSIGFVVLISAYGIVLILATPTPKT
jgi:hypothetical protein